MMVKLQSVLGVKDGSVAATSGTKPNASVNM